MRFKIVIEINVIAKITKRDVFLVEIASRNELGLHTSWKLVSSEWESPLRSQALLKIDGATLTIKQSGLYFIYAQVIYITSIVFNFDPSF